MNATAKRSPNQLLRPFAVALAALALLAGVVVPSAEAAAPPASAVADQASRPLASAADPASRPLASAAADPSGRVLVRWHESADPAGCHRILTDHVPELSEPAVRLTPRVHLLTVGTRHAEAVADRLRGIAAVETAEVDRLLHVAQPTVPNAVVAPNDPLFHQQWGHRNEGQPIGNADNAVAGRSGVDARVLPAWTVTRGSSSVLVAVIDTVIDGTHPDLSGAIAQQLATTPALLTKDPLHGTQVASVIAARADDGTGMAGVAPHVSVVGVAAFDGNRSTLADVLRAFELARQAGAHVINASWVTPVDSALLEAAVADAGVPVVAASGNDSLVLSSTVTAYPASYDLPNLVTVTALDAAGRVPAFANTGRRAVDVAAPGRSVVTAITGGQHGFGDGTSFAAPHVSGALALARSVAPYATTGELIDAVSWTSRPEAALAKVTRTGGMLDTAALVRGIQQPVCRRDRLTASRFADVQRSNAHVAGIDCIVAQGITSGRAPGLYDPNGVVTREQMATFLVKAIERSRVLAPAPPAGFVDVDPNGTHARSIDQLVHLGIVKGGADGRFSPQSPVTRGQLATFLVNAHAYLTDTSAPPSRRWFTDTADSVHAASIDRARDLGLVRGVDGSRFAPGVATRRDQMASLLARQLDALAREGVSAP